MNLYLLFGLSRPLTSEIILTSKNPPTNCTDPCKGLSKVVRRMFKQSYHFVVVGALLIIPFGAPCQVDGSSRAQSKERFTPIQKQERNKTIAIASVDALAKGDVDEALCFADSNIINYGTGQMPPMKGIAIVRASLLQFNRALPITKLVKYQVMAEGDWVMVWGEWSGTWAADMLGQPATRKPFKKKDVEIFKFSEDG
jgi:SnoaL-like polyketide cyclase